VSIGNLKKKKKLLKGLNSTMKMWITWTGSPTCLDSSSRFFFRTINNMGLVWFHSDSANFGISLISWDYTVVESYLSWGFVFVFIILSFSSFSRSELLYNSQPIIEHHNTLMDINHDSVTDKLADRDINLY